MTCAVAVPGRVAADSRDTGTIKRSCTKIFARHGYLIAGAGASAPLSVLEFEIAWPAKVNVEALTRWVYQHHDSEYLDLSEVEMLIVTRREVYTIEDRAVFAAQLGAIGTGGAYALGYLEARPKDLRGAVQAACKFDPYCAGPIREASL